MKKICSISSLLGILLLLISSCSASRRAAASAAAAPDCSHQDINSFGFEVFNDLASDKSVFISPFSLSTALSMTAGGASGTTFDAMASTLGFAGMTGAQLGEHFKAAISQLSDSDSSVVFGTANAIWVDKTIDINKDYKDASMAYYGAKVTESDFRDPSTVKEINAWCSRKTEGRIDNIIDRLNPELKLALLNAIYFKGKWDFDIPDAVKGEFTALDSSVKETDMMNFSGRFAYSENDVFQMVELPYGNGDFVMDILLPKEGLDFRKAVGSLDSDEWNAMVDSLDKFQVSVTMPKFKMEYEADLTDLLKNTGMREAFTPEADFSGMSDSPLSIGIVKQKTYLDVTEQGTEAAAVTFIGMKLTAAPPSRMFSVIADRPFVFAIRELSSGTILFLGQKTE